MRDWGYARDLHDDPRGHKEREREREMQGKTWNIQVPPRLESRGELKRVRGDCRRTAKTSTDDAGLACEIG